MADRISRLFDTDAHFQGRPSHMVDSGIEDDVPVHVRVAADQNVVDGRRHHARIRIEPVYIAEGRLFGHLVQNFQQ